MINKKRLMGSGWTGITNAKTTTIPASTTASSG
jgi:hypothetical protein